MNKKLSFLIICISILFFNILLLESFKFNIIISKSTPNIPNTANMDFWYYKWEGYSLAIGQAVVIDSLDNVYVGGYTLSHGEMPDMCLLKFNNSGTLLWNITWGGDDNEKAFAMALDSSSNIYLAGESSIDDIYYMCVVKFDSSGNFIWNITWGGSSETFANDIEIDSLGNIYLAGGIYNFEKELEICVVKFDRFRNYQWNITSGGNYRDYANDMVLDSSGNIYVVGSSSSSDLGEYDICLVKYDNSSNYQWNRNWGGNYNDLGSGITLDSSGNIFISGLTSSWLGVWGDMCLIKYNNSGYYQWNSTWGGKNDEGAYDIEIDPMGNISLAGNTASFGLGGSDACIVEYNYSGVLQTIATWGDSSDEIAFDMALDSSGNKFITGGIDEDEPNIKRELFLVKNPRILEISRSIPSYNLFIFLSLFGVISLSIILIKRSLIKRLNHSKSLNYF